MIVKVGEHEITIIKTPVNEKEVNVTKCHFEFEMNVDGMVKDAYFTLNGVSYKKIIVNNECDIPSEVLAKKGEIELGVVVYEVENEELKERYNPSPDYFDSWSGSLKDEYENSEPITPTDKEQIEQEIANLQDDVDTLETDVNNLEQAKQDLLISGENIKTINNESLLGGGNLEVITDLSNYYTKEQTENLVNSELEDYYNKDEIDTIKTTIESEIPTKLSELTNDEGFIDNSHKLSASLVDGLSSVATSGNYNDLSNKPTIPTKTSDLTNDSNFEVNTNKVVSISSSSTNTQYPSAKCMYDSQEEQNTQIEDLQEENTYLNSIIDQLPKVNGTGDTITLDNTIEAKMKSKLSPSEMEQDTTTGINLMPMNRPTFTISNVVFTNDNNNSFNLNGKKNSAIGERLTQNFSYSLINGKTYTLAIELLGGTASDLPTISNIAISTSSNNNYKYFSVLDLTTKGQKKVLSWTQNEDADIISYYFWSGGNTTETNYNNYKFRVWLVEGSYTSSTIPDYEPYTGGIASPNPQFPQDIHTTTGDNTIYVNTKNLGYEGWAENFVSRVDNTNKANIETKDNRKCLKFNASAGYQDYDNKYLLKVVWKPNTRYAFKFDMFTTSGSSNIAIAYTDGTVGQFPTITSNTWVTRNIVSATNKTIKYLQPYYSSGDTYIDLDTFQVEEGTSVGDYEKGYQQVLPLHLGTLEYSKIGNYEDEFIIPINSKNLLDLNNFEPATNNSSITLLQTGIKIINASNGYGAKIVMSNLKENTDYYLSYNYEKISETAINRVAVFASTTTSTTIKDQYNASGFTFNTGNNTTINIWFYARNGAIAEVNYTNIILNEGTTALPYEPYNNGKWYLKKNIGKKIFNGTENWYKFATTFSANEYLFRTEMRDIALLPINVKYVYSNYFINETNYGINNSGREGISNLGNYAIVIIASRNFDNYTTDDMKNWVKGKYDNNTPMIAYYPLATPTYTPLNDTLQEQLTNIYNNMMSKKGQTNISQVNDDLPMVISASALLDLNTLVS